MLSFTVATEGDKDASQAIVISVTFSDMFPFSVHHPASWRAWQTWKSLDLLKLCACVKIHLYYNNMQLSVFKNESATLQICKRLNLINRIEKLKKKQKQNSLATQNPNFPFSGLKIQHSAAARIPFLFEPMQHDGKLQEVTEACYAIKVGQHWCKTPCNWTTSLEEPSKCCSIRVGEKKNHTNI